MGWLRAVCSVISVLFLILTSGVISHAAELTVTNTSDDLNPGSLRWAITTANSNGAENTIVFEAGLSGKITLTSALPPITTNQKLTINGPGREVLSIDGAGQYRVFELTETATAGVLIDDLTIENGKSAILNRGPLALVRCDIKGNSDGALYILQNSGQGTTIVDCTFSGNTYDSSGGGAIHQNAEGSSTILLRSTLSGNVSNQDGGAVHNEGGTISLENCTLSNNSANNSYGGAIYNSNAEDCTINLFNCTITQNTAERGGGIYNYEDGVANALNSIIAGNTATDGFINCWGDDLVDQGGNLQYPDNDCNPSIPVANPLLGPLQDNGGPTMTHALSSGSPAIDNVEEGDCTVSADQRGVSRPIDGDGNGSALCDSGSYEYASNKYPPVESNGAKQVPTLNQWGSVFLTLLLAGFALAVIKRKSRIK